MVSSRCFSVSMLVFIAATVLITFASGHEGHHKNQTTVVNDTIDTQAVDNEYKVDQGLLDNGPPGPDQPLDNNEWNNDDYDMMSANGDEEYDVPKGENDTQEEAPESTKTDDIQESTTTLNHIMKNESNDSGNETETIPAQVSANSTDQNQVDDQQFPPKANETVVENSHEEPSNMTNELPPSENAETNEPEATTEEPSKSEEEFTDTTPTTNTEDEETDTPTTTEDSLNITTRSPSPVVTEDVDDSVTKYSPPSDLSEEPESTGLRAWAVVGVSVLVSFTVIFTILYFIRSALIRRRKADQRRLLRGSVSSEGYFYGDGEAHASGKFEL